MSASNEKVNLLKGLFKALKKVQRKKKVIGLHHSYQDWLALFNMHMYDEFRVLHA